MINYRPYSLYAYGQVDGRVTFAHTPHRDNILVNIKQLTLYYNPSAVCNLVVMSYDPGCRIWIDGRYAVSPFEDWIEEGTPFVLGVRYGCIVCESLDPNRFFARY